MYVLLVTLHGLCAAFASFRLVSYCRGIPNLPLQELRKVCTKVNRACGPGCCTASQDWLFSYFSLSTLWTSRSLDLVPPPTMLACCCSIPSSCVFCRWHSSARY